MTACDHVWRECGKWGLSVDLRGVHHDEPLIVPVDVCLICGAIRVCEERLEPLRILASLPKLPVGA